jgi:hypothetical protein
MRLFVLLVSSLLVPAAALAQVTTMSGSRQTISNQGATVVGAAPKQPAPKQPAPTKASTSSTKPDPNGVSTLKPQQPDPNGVSTLKPQQPDPNGVSTLKPQSNPQLLPFEEESKPQGTLLPFTPEPSGPTTKKLRAAIERDAAASETDSANNAATLLAIRDAFDRRDYARVDKLIALAIENQKQRAAALEKRKQELVKLLAASK